MFGDFASGSTEPKAFCNQFCNLFLCSGKWYSSCRLMILSDLGAQLRIFVLGLLGAPVFHGLAWFWSCLLQLRPCRPAAEHNVFVYFLFQFLFGGSNQGRGIFWGYFFLYYFLVPTSCRADLAWIFYFGPANFRKIAGEFLSEFWWRILIAKFSALFFQGFRPTRKIHAQNSRPELSAFLSNFTFSNPKFIHGDFLLAVETNIFFPQHFSNMPSMKWPVGFVKGTVLGAPSPPP